MGSLPLSPSSQNLRVVLTNISIGTPLYSKTLHLKFQLSKIHSIVYFRGMTQPAAATCYMQVTPPTATPTKV